MRLRLPAKRVAALRGVLRRAGIRESGGQIFGEMLAPSDFRVTHLTVQKARGRFASFVVDLVQAARDSARFFSLTSHDYARFNYLGEWHSHPSFELRPSTTDASSMIEMVEDPAFTGNFAVLMIVRIDGDTVAHGAWLYARGGTCTDVEMEME